MACCLLSRIIRFPGTDMLEVSDLTKSFGTAKVLQQVHFAVPQGMLAAILGASGSGKTTLLRLIAGFLQPDAGEVRLDGKVMASSSASLPPERRGIGYVAQEGALFPHLTVAQNIAFGLARAARKDMARIEQLLAIVGLPAHYGQRPPQALSGGEQQRVALARALAPNPRLLLLDEPFSALDAGLRAETRAAVGAALKAAGTTAILVTHDQDEALSMGQKIGVMQRGCLAQWAEPEVLYRHPANPEVAGFVGEAVFLSGEADGMQANCPLGLVALFAQPPTKTVKLMLRPEQIKISSSETGAKARVIKIVYYGHDAALTLQLCQDESVRVRARVPGDGIPEVGGEVNITVTGPVMAYPAE